jgi:release factor glutamine methyltransferase
MTDLSERREPHDVYQPAEDTRLLAEAVEDHVEAGERVLEVGTGSGFVAGIASRLGADVVATDLNPRACRDAREQGLAVARADLVTPFREDTFDWVLFNPPYLPTPPELDTDDWQGTALSGGEDGRRVVDPFLETVGRVLRPDGAVLLLISSLTGIEEVSAFAAEHGLTAREVASEKHPFERLVVLRLAQTNGD